MLVVLVGVGVGWYGGTPGRCLPLGMPRVYCCLLPSPAPSSRVKNDPTLFINLIFNAFLQLVLIAWWCKQGNCCNLWNHKNDFSFLQIFPNSWGFHPMHCNAIDIYHICLIQLTSFGIDSFIFELDSVSFDYSWDMGARPYEESSLRTAFLPSNSLETWSTYPRT